MLPLSPALFVNSARSILGSRGDWMNKSDVSEMSDSLEPAVRDLIMTDDPVGTAAFISHVGYASHSLSRGHSCWPFPLEANAALLHQEAEAKGVVDIGSPEPGAIYMRYSMDKQRFMSAGIVLTAKDAPNAGGGWAYDCIIIEGCARVIKVEYRWTKQNQVEVARFETEVLWVRKTRVWCLPALGDVFIHWVDLDGRRALGNPARKAA